MTTSQMPKGRTGLIPHQGLSFVLFPAAAMMLTLRSTDLSSPIDKNRPDYIVLEDGRAIGRIYQERVMLPELRWFWSITVYVNPMRGIVTSRRGPTIEEAKQAFLTSWERVRAGEASSKT
jgi:hypothetical protein